MRGLSIFTFIVTMLVYHQAVAAPDRRDASTKAAPEITAQQPRPTAAGCDAGPLDRHSSEATKPAADCPDRAPLLKPNLYALVVGIAAYANHDHALVYPAKDARDFSVALQNQKGGLYGDVSIKLLSDDNATKVSILNGLDWLTRQVTSRDVGLVYLSGHGMLDERDRFYFLATDSDATRPRSTAVPHDDINDALGDIAGKAVLFLDVTHAGIASASGRRDTDINLVVNDFSRGERVVVVFAASTGRQVSQESAAWNNGAFTKAIVEGLGLPGLKPLADYRNGAITISELAAYVTDRVRTLTNGSQSPVMIRPKGMPDFPFAIAR